MKKQQEYAIVDIETTGGYAKGSKITEIAIVIHDGNKVIDRYESLVNPEQNIPLPIFALTGINKELVKDAPIFEEIAPKVEEMLTDRIFVAHNVNFDYSFVHKQLKEVGIKWNPKKLCTVRAARKIRPGLPSYSLGNLCLALGITVENRHRAGGDADATAILFTKLLLWDENNEIEKMLKRNAREQNLPPNLPKADFEKLPQATGIYYFYNKARKVIYVGKAKNIKSRVATHFNGNNTSQKRQNFMNDIYAISFEICASEFVALLLECIEIKKLWPQYNRALKNFEPKYGLYTYEAINGYKHLVMCKTKKNQNYIQSFYSIQEATENLQVLTSKFNIDHRFCIYTTAIENGNNASQNKDNLPCKDQHNNAVNEAIDHLQSNKQTFLIVEKGRTTDEKCYIWIENSKFYGMGYIHNDIQIINVNEIKEHLTPYQSNYYMMQLIIKYAKNNPRKVIEINTPTKNQ